MLSDEDLAFEERDRESMFKKLEEKLGITKPELEVILREIQLS
jgi:hypothetical protein